MDQENVKHFESSEDFRDWLREHHATREELWVGYWKKATGRPSITWEESVDEALCFGWIDGIRKRLDDEAYNIRFTPRRAESNWSRRNVDRYTALERAGRMAPPGRAAFERGKPDGTGTYSLEEEQPPELDPEYLRRLRANSAAWADWQSRPEGYRRQVSHWVMSAKRESTRERRLAALIEDCAAGRKVKPLRL